MREECRLEPRAISLLRTTSGKPSLGSGEGLEFNVAHSGNCVLIAWSRSGPVGVDVEAARPGNRGLFMEMAKPAFSTQELALLHAATEAEMSEIFYRIWVRKEAVAKAYGVGAGGPLRSFSVAERVSEGIRWCENVQFPTHGPTWKIVDLYAASGHAASLAVPAGTAVEKCLSIPANSDKISLFRSNRSDV